MFGPNSAGIPCTEFQLKPVSALHMENLCDQPSVLKNCALLYINYNTFVCLSAINQLYISMLLSYLVVELWSCCFFCHQLPPYCHYFTFIDAKVQIQRWWKLTQLLWIWLLSHAFKPKWWKWFVDAIMLAPSQTHLYFIYIFQHIPNLAFRSLS